MADLDPQGVVPGDPASLDLADRHPYVTLEARNGTSTFHHICTSGPRFICLTCPGKPWTWDRYSDTITPSIHCPDCGVDGSWTNGAWVPSA